MSARIFKRCGCRDADGKQLKACPQLKDRGHGTWTARVELPRTQGKRNTKERGGFPRKAAAEEWAKDVLGAYERGVRNFDHRLTTGEWLDRWLTAKTSATGISGYGQPVRPSTASVYRLHVGYLKEHIGDVPLADLGVEHVVRAYDEIRADSERAAKERELKTGKPSKGLSATSIKRIHAALRAALQAAVKTGHKTYNPCLQVTFDAQPKQERTKLWTPAQLGTFLQHVRDHRLGLVYEVLAAGGLRRGEGLGLQWDDIDLTRGVVRIRRQLLNTWADGAPTFGPPKSDAGSRDLALPSSTVDALKLHRLTQDFEREKWGSAYEDFGLVFCQENGRPYDPSKVTKTFTALVKAAGLPRIRLHDLRHLAATRLLAAGVPIATVSKRLGHSSIDITVDTYGHQDDEADRIAAEAGWGVVIDPERSESR